MNLALLLSIFFSLWKQVRGPESTIPFPGPKAAYQALHIDTSAGINPRFQIFASLTGDQINGQAYNIAGPVTNWAELWPLMAAEFGLVGLGHKTMVASTRQDGSCSIKMRDPYWRKSLGRRLERLIVLVRISSSYHTFPSTASSIRHVLRS